MHITHHGKFIHSRHPHHELSHHGKHWSAGQTTGDARGRQTLGLSPESPASHLFGGQRPFELRSNIGVHSKRHEMHHSHHTSHHEEEERNLDKLKKTLDALEIKHSHGAGLTHRKKHRTFKL